MALGAWLLWLIVTQAMPPLTLNIIFCRNLFLQTTCQVFTLVVVEYLMKVMSERYLNSKIGNMHVSCLVHDPYAYLHIHHTTYLGGINYKQQWFTPEHDHCQSDFQSQIMPLINSLLPQAPFSMEVGCSR